MNSLFVGPYRQSNISGLWSRCLLSALHKKIPEDKALVSRNFYVDSGPLNAESSLVGLPDIKNIESYKANIEQLIQHVPINTIYYSQYIKSNICIPIISNMDIDDSSLQKLSECNKVLVDNSFLYNKLKDKLSNLYYITYDNILINKLSTNYSLGVHGAYTKFYFIGSYPKNRDIVYDLILTFILYSHKKDDSSLVLFLTDVSKKDTDALQQSIQFLYGALNITNVFSKIALVPINATLDNFIACHKSGDIYLNINDDTKQAMQTNYAKLYNSKIIDLTDLHMEYRYNRNENIGSNLVEFPTQHSILQAYDNIDNIITNNQYETYPIEQIVWN